MAVFGLNFNLAAARVERRLQESSRTLSGSYERLSSGMRIERASDDAAGLAIASSLNIDQRVYTQGIRNVNDGLSLLAVTSSALDELTNITVRQKELAEQAANGTLSSAQRLALHREARALSDEYNRIVRTVGFNNTQTLYNPSAGLTVQSGYGISGGVNFMLGSELGRPVGDGTFSTTATFGGTSGKFVTADFNGDSYLDIVTSSTGSNTQIVLGNGDGTFGSVRAAASGAGLTDVGQMTAGDINGDSRQDLLMLATGGFIFAALGNGDGTFRAAVSGIQVPKVSFNPFNLMLQDFDNDGKKDAIAVSDVQKTFYYMRGNGDGTFGNYNSVSLTIMAGGNYARYSAMGDLNLDGKVDFIASGSSGVEVYLNTGGGAVDAGTRVLSGYNSVATVDLNNDGRPDIIAGSSSLRTMLGNGDGTFGPSSNFAFAGDIAGTGDFNGDGAIDVLLAPSGSSYIQVALNDGTGNFLSAAQTQSVPVSTANGFGIGDFNRDDILDLLYSNTSNERRVMQGDVGGYVTTVAGVDLTLAGGARAALTTLTAQLQRVSEEKAAIGAVQSRLGTGLSNLSQSIGEYAGAEERIRSIDIAEESATLLKSTIIQNAGSSILAQANQSSQLALTLLSNLKG